MARITVVDIAQKVGVSPSTVSRVIRGVGNVNPEVRQKVLAEARRAGYRPDNAARALRYQSSRLIGLMVPSFFSFQIDDLVTAIQVEAQNRGYGVLMGTTLGEPENELQLLRFMASKQVEGIILRSFSTWTAEFIEEIHHLQETGTRIVHLLDVIDVPGVYSVVADNTLGGYLATRHLLDLGHTQILYISSLDESPRLQHFSNERFAGMMQAYQEQGLQRPRGMVVNETHRFQGYHSIQEALDRGMDFTALFAYSDRIAFGSIMALKERGIRIPENCSVVGFDDAQAGEVYIEPTLTSVRQNDDEIGREAINLILGNHPPPAENLEERVRVVKPTLTVRSSTTTLEETKPMSAMMATLG